MKGSDECNIQQIHKPLKSRAGADFQHKPYLLKPEQLATFQPIQMEQQMGRGLSAQQKQILAAGVAINARRNGGIPAPAEILIDHAAGVIENTIFGPRPRRRRRIMTAVTPEITEGFLLTAFAGFRRAPVDYGTALRWSETNHSRRVSLTRAAESLVKRELIARTWSPRDFFGPWNKENDRSRWSQEQLLAHAINESLPASTLEFWSRWRRYATAAYSLTAEAFSIVGDEWRSVDAAAMEQAFRHAEGYEEIERERRRRAERERTAPLS